RCLMTISYQNKKPVKLKKNIKWYTYVDSSLDLKLKVFMEEYRLNNQARIIRNFVNHFMDYFEAMFKKNSYNDPQVYDEKKIDNLIREAIKTYEIGNSFYEELKQKLSPLKVSLLMLNNYVEENEIFKDVVQNAIDALGELEISVKRHFEEPNIVRFVKKVDILYVEDNELERKTIDNYFKSNDFDIKSLETSDEAFYVLKNLTPRVILLDINLKTSNINGDRLCQILKSSSQYNTIPIILISAVFCGENKEEILTKTGADDIIFKPIDRLKDLDILFKYLKKY
ncbi:MAG: PleD family two-component system response regulator, partial [Candidatus Thorarchaeota archaeon]